MSFPHSSVRRQRGFTLIELLVVVAIIAILAGVLSSVLGGVQTRARKIQAMNDMRNIKVTILNYYADYQKYPINAVQQNAVQYGDYDTVFGDPGGLYSNANLFNVLRGVADDDFNKENVLNPSKTVYWQGPLAKSEKVPRGGISTKEIRDGDNVIKQGSLMDSWGNPYLVWIDANRDGDLSTAAGWFYSDIKAGEVTPGQMPMGLEFGSLGPDGEFGTKENGILKGSDDIVSWQ